MTFTNKRLAVSIARSCVTLAAVWCGERRANADDWGQWMGPNRDGVYSEQGIIDSIPDDGLKVKWRTPVNGGYAGPAVADGKVFVFDYTIEDGKAFNEPGQRANVQGKERIMALDATGGNAIWSHQYDCPYSISYPAGPRCTPNVDGDRVYTLGSEGDLLCMETDGGQVVWQRSLK